MVKLGCGIIVFLFLYGCSCQDHGRTLVMTVEEGGQLDIGSIEVLLEKSGTEASDAKNDGEFSLKTTAL